MVQKNGMQRAAQVMEGQAKRAADRAVNGPGEGTMAPNGAQCVVVFDTSGNPKPVSNIYTGDVNNWRVGPI